MLKRLYEWCTKFTFRIDDGDSRYVKLLYDLFPDVELPQYEVVGPLKDGLLYQWNCLAVKFQHDGKMYGQGVKASGEIPYTPTMLINETFRGVLLGSIITKMRAAGWRVEQPEILW